MNYHCPSCNEIIHDRTRKVCGICGNALSGALLLCMARAGTSLNEAAEAADGHKRNRDKTEAEEQKRSDGEGLLA